MVLNYKSFLNEEILDQHGKPIKKEDQTKPVVETPAPKVETPAPKAETSAPKNEVKPETPKVDIEKIKTDIKTYVNNIVTRLNNKTKPEGQSEVPKTEPQKTQPTA